MNNKTSFYEIEGTEKSQVINAEGTVRKYQERKYGKYFGESVRLDELADKVDKYIGNHESYLTQLRELKAKVTAALRQENAQNYERVIKTMSVEELQAALEEKMKDPESESAA